MTSETLTVPEIHCDHCKMSLEDAVAALPGVQEVRVSVDERTLELTYDEDRLDRAAIIEAIEEQGYQVPGP
jgi:copper chaperone